MIINRNTFGYKNKQADKRAYKISYKRAKNMRQTIFIVCLILIFFVGFFQTVNLEAYSSPMSEASIEFENKIYQDTGIKSVHGEKYFNVEFIKQTMGVGISLNKVENSLLIDWNGMNAEIFCLDKKDTADNSGGFPVIIDNKAYVPLSFISNVLKYEATFNQKTNVYVFKYSRDSSGQPINQGPGTAVTDSNSASGKLIAYLTFDDGIDAKNTTGVLDVLKEKNVNATFFIIGNTIKSNTEILKRIVSEGNSIGNHTYSHNTDIIYSSLENFENEVKKTNYAFVETIGKGTLLVRPPYGIRHVGEASIESYFASKYIIQYWNIDSRDTVEKGITPEKILRNIKIGTYGKEKLVILMHCSSSNENTVIALPLIIDWLKNSGYTFETLNKN